MHAVPFAIEQALRPFRIGNVAVAAALLLMPLVLATGFLTDREPLPGHGVSARAGVLAAADRLTARPPG